MMCRRTTLAAVAAVVLAIATATTATAASAAHWTPHMRQAIHYAAQRHGIISFAVKTSHRQYNWHAKRTVPSASVLKAMLLVTYLNMRSVRHRSLSSSEKHTLGPMIKHSSNSAANTIINRVGLSRLRALARRAHMHHFSPTLPIWGNSRINADDQVRFFYRIDKLIPKRHRRYAMYQLAHVTPSQRWGIGRVQPEGWRIYFKGGWGSGTGRVDHQVALLTRGRERVSVAILTYLDGSHAYGKETLRGVAKRLLRGLAESQRPAQP